MAMVNMTARGSGGKQKQPAVNGMTGQPFPQQGGGQQAASNVGQQQGAGFSGLYDRAGQRLAGGVGPGRQGGGQQLGNSQDMMGRGPMFANRLGGLAPQGGGQQMANQPLFRQNTVAGNMRGMPGQQLNSFRPYQMAQNGYGRAPQGNFGMMQGMGQQMGVLAGGMGQQMQQPQFGNQMGAVGQQLMQQRPQFGAGWGAVAGMGQGMAQPQMNAMQGFGQQMMQQPQFGNQPGQAMGSAGRFMQHLAQRNQPGQAMRGMQDQMLNQQAIAANGEPAVTDFFNQLMASPDYQGGPPPQQQAYR